MNILGFFGGLLTLAGLVGLLWCMAEGLRVRRLGASGPEIAARLRRLIAVNLGSVAGAALGLGLLAVYLILG